jgi:hypothetical protein
MSAFPPLATRQRTSLEVRLVPTTDSSTSDVLTLAKILNAGAALATDHLVGSENPNLQPDHLSAVNY